MANKIMKLYNTLASISKEVNNFVDQSTPIYYRGKTSKGKRKKKTK